MHSAVRIHERDKEKSRTNYNRLSFMIVKCRDISTLPDLPSGLTYQSLDLSDGRLYIAHTNADELVVFDTKKSEVVANLPRTFNKRVSSIISCQFLAEMMEPSVSDCCFEKAKGS